MQSFLEFKQYINQAWTIHATDTHSVFNSFNDGVNLITSNEDILVMVRLIKHVCGDHLGLWQDGIEKLQNLRSNPNYISHTESDFAINRSVATFKLCSGENNDLSVFSLSDQIRIFAQAAAMISERGEVNIAEEYLTKSLDLVSLGIPKEDPALRELAITGNNLACGLEEKTNRSETEMNLMILAAKTGRKFWELAGGPSEIASAEYRLSQSY